MENILAYINTFTTCLFNRALLLSPDTTIANLGTAFTFPDGATMADVIAKVLSNPELLFSTVVWGLFGFLTINLLLVVPYKFVKAVIKRCRIS